MSSIHRCAFLLTLCLFVATTNARAQVYVASGEVPDLDLTVELTIDVDLGQLHIRAVGPVANWFAWGLGNNIMSDTYALVTNADGSETMVERKLANHAEGAELAPSISIDSSTVDGATLEVMATRSLTAAGEDYYEFDIADVENGVPINVIYARGQGTAFQYHGPTRSPSSVEFEKGGTSSVPDEDEPPRRGPSWGELKFEFRRIR